MLLITELRQKKGLTFKKLAKKAKVSPTAVRELEHGETRYPRIDTLVKLAKALNYQGQVYELIEEVTNPKKTQGQNGIRLAKKLRLEKGYSLEKLAKLAKISTTTIKKIEDKNYDNARRETLWSIAKALEYNGFHRDLLRMVPPEKENDVDKKEAEEEREVNTKPDTRKVEHPIDNPKTYRWEELPFALKEDDLQEILCLGPDVVRSLIDADLFGSTEVKGTRIISRDSVKEWLDHLYTSRKRKI